MDAFEVRIWQHGRNTHVLDQATASPTELPCHSPHNPPWNHPGAEVEALVFDFVYSASLAVGIYLKKKALVRLQQFPGLLFSFFVDNLLIPHVSVDEIPEATNLV